MVLFAHIIQVARKAMMFVAGMEMEDIGIKLLNTLLQCGVPPDFAEEVQKLYHCARQSIIASWLTLPCICHACVLHSRKYPLL